MSSTRAVATITQAVSAALIWLRGTKPGPVMGALAHAPSGSNNSAASSAGVRWRGLGAGGQWVQVCVCMAILVCSNGELPFAYLVPMRGAAKGNPVCTK